MNWNKIKSLEIKTSQIKQTNIAGRKKINTFINSAAFGPL